MMQEKYRVARSGKFIWAHMEVPKRERKKIEDLLPGLSAAIEDDGTIWAWCGLLGNKSAALMLAASDGEYFVFENGQCYLRLSWLKENMISPDDETGHEIVRRLEDRMKTAISH